MPFFTSSEVAKDYGLPTETVYYLAKTLSGFFPDGKAAIKGRGANAHSVYSLYKHRLLGVTLDRAPGSTVEEKVNAIYDGYQLPDEEKKMIYQSMSTKQLDTMTSQISEIWNTIKGLAGNFAPVRGGNKEQFLPEFEGLSPEEARQLAIKDRLMNGEKAYLVVRRKLEADALQYVADRLPEFGSALSSSQIVDMVSEYNKSLGAEFQKKGTAWRRFRSRLIDQGYVQAGKRSGYVTVVRATINKGN